MKNIKLLFLFALSLSVFSCSDPCDDVNCGANGVCVEGDCNCNEGYEGTFCDTEIRAKYLGTYSGDFSACLGDLIDPQMIPGDFSMLNVQVVADPDNVNNVMITLANNLLPTDSIITDPTDGVFIIPTTSQTIDVEQIPFPVTITISGSGEFIDEDNFTISFSIIIPLVQPIECTVTMTKI